MEITKLDAARRQLLAAIHLNWFLMEPLAAYQLAANAHEICDAILRHRGRKSMREHIAEVHGWSTKEIAVLFNEPRNFMKHADRDPDALMEDIDPVDCDAAILTGCLDYAIACGRTPMVFGVFIAWYAAINPTKTGDFFEGGAQTIFPDLEKATREQQVRAAREYSMRRLDGRLLNDLNNEMTDSWRWHELRLFGQDFRVD